MPFVPTTTPNPTQSEQPQLTFRRTQETPWSQDPPDTSSKLVIRRRCWVVDKSCENRPRGRLVSVFSVAFVRLRSTPSGVPVMQQAGTRRTTGSRVEGVDDSNRDITC